VGDGIAFQSTEEGIIASGIVADLQVQLQNVELGEQATDRRGVRIGGVVRVLERGSGCRGERTLETLLEGDGRGTFAVIFGVEGSGATEGVGRG
jgi:hypothetical protein